jgi:hypothetical protein
MTAFKDRLLALLDAIDRAQDNAFRCAINLADSEFLKACGDGALKKSLQSHTISEPTLLEIAVRLAASVRSEPNTAIPLLLDVLLAFNPDDPFVASYLKPILDRIILVTTRLRAAGQAATPFGIWLEQLSVVARSFKLGCLD